MTFEDGTVVDEKFISGQIGSRPWGPVAYIIYDKECDEYFVMGSGMPLVPDSNAWEDLKKSIDRFYSVHSDESIRSGNALTAYDEVRDKSQCGYVYLMKCTDGLYKIGRSIHPVARLDQIKKQKGRKGTELIHQIPTSCMDLFESEMHKRFKSKRVRWEWFKLDQEDVGWICSLTERPVAE